MPEPLIRQWQWTLPAAPEALWPFVADTNRFNRDVGLTPVSRPSRDSQRTSMRILGMTIEWDEEPFEWLYPHRFSSLRRYHRGPFTQLKMSVSLSPISASSTLLALDFHIVPRSVLTRMAGAFQLRGFHRAISRTYHRYAALAQQSDRFTDANPASIRLAEGGQSRLTNLTQSLVSAGADPRATQALAHLLQTAHDFALDRIRPYALADALRLNRRAVLETCLYATRAGLLESRWNILCPLCRGPADQPASLRDLTETTHCGSCNIDFTTSFDLSTELIFRPSPSIRPIAAATFCYGSPELTPHIVAQTTIAAGGSATLSPSLKPGRYRLRTPLLRGAQHLMATTEPDASNTLEIVARPEAFPSTEPSVSLSPTLTLQNQTPTSQCFILERTAWSDLAATAAEVTTLQKFRDLFSSESLRPGQQISIGSLTILFTDLKSSTQLYRSLGDAPAFGRVMSHFDILTRCIAEESGAMIKTIGDAVMAAFTQPLPAIRAILKAQRLLASPAGNQLPLRLKAGIHCGPCIAVTLNDRLDYFGTTVNIAARLVELSTGCDLVLSRPVRDDPLVAAHLDGASHHLEEHLVPIKGLDAPLSIWTLTPATIEGMPGKPD